MLAALRELVREVVREVLSELAPHLRNATEYVTSDNCKRIYGREWRSIAAAAKRAGVARLRIAGKAAFRRAELEAAFERAGAVARRPAKTIEEHKDDYERAVEARRTGT